MQPRAHAFVTGLFVLAIAALGAFSSLWLSGKHEVVKRFTVVSTASVSGLNRSAPVRFRGVQVGEVKSIAFNPKDPREILIGIEVGADTPLTTDAFAQLAIQGLTGLSAIELSTEGKSQEMLSTSNGNPARIVMRPSFFESVTNSGQKLIEQANHVADRVLQLLGPQNQKSFAESLGNIANATERLESILAEARPAIVELPRIARSIEDVLGEAKLLGGKLNGLSDETKEQVARTQEVAQNLKQLAVNLDSFRAQAQGSTLPQLQETLFDLSRASSSLHTLSESLKRAPQSVLTGPPPKRPGPGEPGWRGK